MTSGVKQNRLHKWLIGGPPLAYLVVFFAIPVLIMVLASFRNPGEFGGLAPIFAEGEGGGQLDLTTESYGRFFSDFLYTQLFLKSFAYAAVTTVACLVIAYPLAMLIARSPKKHRDLLVLLVILPFWSNFLIRVYAWMIILGPQSVFVTALNNVLGLFGLEPVTLLYTAFAVIVGLVYVHLPFMVLPLYANLEKHDPALLDAAQDLGANAWRRFWRGLHSRAGYLRHPGYPRRHRGYHDRQRDQAAVSRHARLALRQCAVDGADGDGSGDRRTGRLGRTAVPNMNRWSRT